MFHISAEDALRILDLAEGASSDEIKNAYRITALEWHPDRHYNRYSKEIATMSFLEATNAYRTLVREGYVNPFWQQRNIPSEHRTSSQLPIVARMNSSESSMSRDSFVHLVASSTESLTTAPSISARSSWKQGVRRPANSRASQCSSGLLRPMISNNDPPAMINTNTFFPSKHPISRPRNLSLNRGTKSINGRLPKPLPPQPSLISAQLSAPKFATQNFQRYDHKLDLGQRAKIQRTPYSIPLTYVGTGLLDECVYSLPLTLEEAYTGKHLQFSILRSYMSKKPKHVVIKIDIPPGSRSGTKILCRNVGHEFKPGRYQDIAFVVEELPHDRFLRLFDDLIICIRLPGVDSLRRRGGRVPFTGVDGRSLVFHIDYPRDKNLRGCSLLKGAGMPIREHGQVVGTGDLIIQWEIMPTKTRLFHFIKRLFPGRKS